MLVDPLPVKYPQLSAASALTITGTDSYALVDLAPGKSVRRCAACVANACPSILTISHSVSKENGAVPTDRLLVRLDLEELTSVSGEAGNLKAFAYLVVGIPRGALGKDGNTFNKTVLVEMLLGAVAVSPTAATTSNANLDRMIAGEP